MIYGIIGECDAKPKLVTAALNDQLEHHAQNEEEFWLCVGVRRPVLAIYRAIIEWAHNNEIYTAYFSTVPTPQLLRELELDEVHEHTKHDNYMLELVERLYHEVHDNGESAMLYALLGDQEPSVEVRRAIARAVDNGIEVRDLAEAGLTVVGMADNPIKTTGRIIMATEEITLAEAGEAADEGDEEAIGVLTQYAEQFELDPDEYATWAMLAEALDPLIAAEEQEEEEEEEAPRSRRGAKAKLTAEDLEEKSVSDLRALAKSLGVDGWDRNRSAKLIQGILAAQDGDDGEGESPAPSSRAARTAQSDQNGDSFAAILARGLRAFADAIEA